MIDKNLVQILHDDKVIDKRHVLWWQLGFEGREILSEEEFSKGLQTVRRQTIVDPVTQKPIESSEREFQVWTRDNVPILLREIDFGGITVPCFISVKPQSHEVGAGGYSITHIFEEPHIRGMAIERKDKFLFWYPFVFGEPSFYQTRKFGLEGEKMQGLICPIHPRKFYKNLVEDGWSGGRRAQKKAKEFDCKKEGFELVPYFEFNPDKKHVMVYPVQLFENTLDFPVFIKSCQKKPKVEVLGIGYACFGTDSSAVYYWEIQKQHKKLVRETLERNFKLEEMAQ